MLDVEHTSNISELLFLSTKMHNTLAQRNAVKHSSVFQRHNLLLPGYFMQMKHLLVFARSKIGIILGYIKIIDCGCCIYKLSSGFRVVQPKDLVKIYCSRWVYKMILPYISTLESRRYVFGFKPRKHSQIPQFNRQPYYSKCLCLK